MEYLKLGKCPLESSRLLYGCMRIAGDDTIEDRKKGKAAVRAAWESGYNHFDHADIYGAGRCEELFGEVLQEVPGMREKVLITTKCGIRFKGNPHPEDPVRYDFSRAYIMKSVEGSLNRLKVDAVDILLLHRPDYLFKPDEVADAFRQLRDSGKVKYFGVSNFSPAQVTLLQKFCDMPLITNQVEINIHKIDTLLDGTLDQCQVQNIVPQAWCPLGGVVYPAWGNTFSRDAENRIKKELDYQAGKYQAENWIIMLAWLLKHPATIFPIIGTTNPGRIKMAPDALKLRYSREDWYRLLEARNGRPVP
ncbi:aldo/keto reductase family oxidoreductase [Fibrobacterota bacterium]